MSTSNADTEVQERYKICLKCLTDDYVPGGAHCAEVIAKRLALAESNTTWLNPFYIEKHAQLEQPYKNEVCAHCPFKEEHEMREFVSKL